MTRYISCLLVVLPLLFSVGCVDKKDPSESKKISLNDAVDQENVLPVAIIGSGPSGLSAAVYVARAGIKSFVFAGPTPRGQLTQTSYVENWPGRERVMGGALMTDIEKQAVSFGATIVHDTISEIDNSVWPYRLKTDEGRSFSTLSIIITTGATPKTLGIRGEHEYWGKGVTTCAVCDAPFFKDKEVVISGGGDSAAEMVFELAPYVKKVTMLVRKDKMRASAAMQEKVLQFSNAQVRYRKEIEEIFGDGDKVKEIDVYDNKTDTTERHKVDGVFLAIGHTPNSQLVKNKVPLDDAGYIKMKDRSQESLVPGIFAAGEIQDPIYRQAIVASGEGVKAALDTTSFLYSLGFNVDVGKKLDQNFFETFKDDSLDLEELTEKSELYSHVFSSKKPAFLDFYATNCPACLKMLPSMEAVAHKFKDKVRFFKVNYRTVFKTIYAELYHKHGIKFERIPALLVFKDGKFVEINNRVMSRRELSEYVQQFID